MAEGKRLEPNPEPDPLDLSYVEEGEVVRLQVTDIDTDRRMIHIRQSKGRKDRYVMLSKVAEKAFAVI